MTSPVHRTNQKLRPAFPSPPDRLCRSKHRTRQRLVKEPVPTRSSEGLLHLSSAYKRELLAKGVRLNRALHATMMLISMPLWCWGRSMQMQLVWYKSPTRFLRGWRDRRRSMIGRIGARPISNMALTSLGWGRGARLRKSLPVAEVQSSSDATSKSGSQTNKCDLLATHTLVLAACSERWSRFSTGR